MRSIAFFLISAAVVLGLSVFAFSHYGSKFDKESKNFVDQKIPIITKNWNYSYFYSHASKNFKNTTSEKQLRDLFSLWDQKLGRLQTYRGSEGESNIMVHFPKVILIRAYYVANIDFEKDNGTIKVGLVYKPPKWEIEFFRLESKGFAQP